MKEYRSSPRRLVNFFKKSRDKWKARAARYHRKIRALQVSVHDLKKSRDHWKQRAKQAENRSSQQETASSDSGSSEDERRLQEKSIDSITRGGEKISSISEEVKEGEYIPHGCSTPCLNEMALEIPYGHAYPVFVMKLAIEQLVDSFASVRGCQHTLESFSNEFHFPVPSFTAIRNWWFRLGLYVLQQPAEARTDWIILVDMTIASGKAECLLVAGIPQASLPIAISSSKTESTTYALGHHDVELLGLEIMENPTGDAVYQYLETLLEKVGVVRQIVADHGGDIRKVIELYQEKHQDTVYTYDVTHQMALILEHELKDDKRFNDFKSKCTTTLREVQQTELYCIKPPTQRTKARYHNIDTYVDWAQATLRFRDRGDFSEFGTRFTMDAETLVHAGRILDRSFRDALCEIAWKTYPTREAFIHNVIAPLGDGISEQQRGCICTAADEGRRRFDEKLGWLSDYREEINLYSQFIDIVHTAEKQVKHEGLNRESEILFKERLQGRVLLPRAQHIEKQVMDYLHEEGNKIPEGQTLLGTSDVLESLIAKLKIFLGKGPLREIGQMILSAPLFTIDIADRLVKNAMEAIGEMDVINWRRKTLGKSALAKRRALLGENKMGTKVE